MIHPLVMAAMACGGRGTVTISGETISDTGGAPARATVIFNTDGTVDKRESTTVTQIDSATDWIIPNVYAGSLYEIKYELDSGDALTETNMVVSTWADMGTTRTMGYATSDPGTESGTITVSIRFNGGPVLDTGQYVLSATEV